MAEINAQDLTVKTKEGNTNTYEFVQPDGYYQEMTVGDAEQLVATVGVTDKVPYHFRPSAGSADIGNRETDEITGGSLVWNQLSMNGDFSNGTSGWNLVGGTFTVEDGVATVTYGENPGGGSFRWRKASGVEAPVNHKIFASFDIRPNTAISNAVYASLGYDSININRAVVNIFNGIAVGTWATRAAVINAAESNTFGFRIGATTAAPFMAGESFSIRNVMIIDLTAMFGSTIADYIYSLETATAGAGVAWFRKLFPKPYYAYNANGMRHVSGVSAHKMVGFNAYNPETGTAVLLGGNQYQITGAYTALSYTDIGGNAETITPDSNGLFTPASNGTLTVTGGNSTDTCVHLVWSGTHNGEYEPYEVHEYALDDSLTLRGVPKLDANNELYYDGDTYASDGTVTRYWTERAYQDGDVSDGSTMITDGTTTVYKLATPTTETAEPYTNPQIVNDWGTEEYVTDSIVPVGHTTTYGANLRDKLQHLPDLADGDGNFLIQQTGTQMALVPFRIPQATGADGTYVLKATVSGGTPTYAWVLEE